MTRELDTCWSLIDRAAAGDGAAGSRFAQAYLDVVRAFFGARWRGSPRAASVEDAVQEVFLDLFRSGGALQKVDRERGANFRSFLFGVAHRVALRHEERAARQAGAVALDSSVSSADTSVSRVFDRHWARAMIARAVERQRRQAAASGARAERRVELLRQRFQEGLPIREIAAAWGEDPAHVHREYAKARDEFKQALRAEVGEHLTGPPGAVDRECRMLLGLL